MTFSLSDCSFGPTSKHSRAHYNMLYLLLYSFSFRCTDQTPHIQIVYIHIHILIYIYIYIYSNLFRLHQKLLPTFSIPCSLPWIKLFSFFFLHPSLQTHLLRLLDLYRLDQPHDIRLGSLQLELFIVTLALAMLSLNTATSSRVMYLFQLMK